MSKTLKLLLTESVESLGIVGDVVNVRLGYARNFLLPRNLATVPTDEAVKAVAARRAEAEKQLAELRKQREALIGKLDGVEVTIQRSCNDLGHLYASVTQQEIAKALEEAGHTGVRPRDVRLHQNIKRVDTYDVHVKFESDLEAVIKLWVVADRKLDIDKAREDAEAADHAAAETPAQGDKPALEAGDKPPAAKGKADKDDKARSDKAASEGGEKPAGEKAAREDKPRKKDKAPKSKDAAPAEEPKKVSGWGKPVERPSFEGIPARRGRRERE